MVSPTTTRETGMLDWNAICRIEPGLLDLESLAILLGGDEHYVNYEKMKKRMWSYVGRGAEQSALRNQEAWDIAMEHIALRCAP